DDPRIVPARFLLARVVPDPVRARPVKQRHHRANAVLLQQPRHPAVTFDCVEVEPTLLGLNSTPFNGEAVAPQSQFMPHAADVFVELPPVIALAVPRHLRKVEKVPDPAGETLETPPVAVDVFSFDLMRGGCRPPEKG